MRPRLAVGSSLWARSRWLQRPGSAVQHRLRLPAVNKELAFWSGAAWGLSGAGRCFSEERRSPDTILERIGSVADSFGLPRPSEERGTPGAILDTLCSAADTYGLPKPSEEAQELTRILQDLQNVMVAHFGHLKLASIDPLAVYCLFASEQARRTAAWKAEQASAENFLQDLSGDARLFKELWQHAQIADVAYLPDEDAVRSALQALGYELTTSSMEARPNRPAHILATRPGRVVLAIRGTQSISDCITDALCDGQPFEGGYAHRGVTRAAAWLCEEYSDALRHFEAEGYDVVVVGHSLGAATAAATTIKLRSSGKLQRARCICFAPPATVNQELADACSSYVTSVVNDDDLIPRSQISTLLRLYHDAVSYDWLPGAKAMVQSTIGQQKRKHWVIDYATNYADHTFGTLESKLELRRAAQLEHCTEVLEEVERVTEELLKKVHPLRIPGFVIHMYRSPGQVGYGALKVDADRFNCIELSSTMVTDHLLDAYLEALLTLSEAAEAEHREQVERLSSFIPEGLAEKVQAPGEALEKAAAAARTAKELIFKARAKLQSRPDTS